ncbi:MAG: hypothetical protein EOP10_10790 [Proteobacteria bacterium]|nr:MAG: hypothetical protein EOP10_10790 [Pseudomonadota bacterium]
MAKTFLTLLIITGFTAREASAFETGAGIGRLQSCFQTTNDQLEHCAIGPSISGFWGLNLWGKGYDVSAHESSADNPMTVGEGTAKRLATNPSTTTYNYGSLFSHVDSWQEVAIVVVASLFLVSIGYAFIYPFSSRADVGLIGRVAYQEDRNIYLTRSEAGIYFRGYLSQHFPLYIYGSGLFSHQNLSFYHDEQSYNVFVKRLGLGFMSPTTAGAYLQGTWERSSLIDPSAKDILEDSTTNKFKNQSIRKILDASHFELGYTWYY